jgi:hypothetical protein
MLWEHGGRLAVAAVHGRGTTSADVRSANLFQQLASIAPVGARNKLAFGQA